MTDIVERLRALSYARPEPQPFEVWREAVGTAFAAADVIKQLRAEVERKSDAIQRLWLERDELRERLK